ncbi:MAG: response regulator [Anaerolineae bacterium]|nr:response regulator [Anaerolineae bacterium]
MAKNISPIEGSSVLITTDDIRLARDLGFLLTVAGLNSSNATIGAEALRVMKHQMPDLLLLDLDMPGDDGLDLLRRLRADGRYNGLAIIAMSESDELSTLTTALDIGADDFLAKPFDVYDVLDSIKRVMIDRMTFQRAS